MPEIFMNFDSSQAQGDPTSGTMYFNLTPPVTVPQDATNVTLNCANASLWNSVPNCQGKVIEVKIEILKVSWSPVNYLDATIALRPDVLATALDSKLDIPTGLYSTGSLSTVLTDLVFSKFTLDPAFIDSMTDEKKGVLFNDPTTPLALKDRRNLLMLEEIVQALEIQIIPVPGANLLKLQVQWNMGDHEMDDVWPVYINDPKWLVLMQDVDNGSSKLNLGDAKVWKADRFFKFPSKFAMSHLLRHIQIEFKVGPYSVLRDLCGFTNPILINLSETTSASNVVEGYTIGQTIPKFDKLQYFLISCTLAASGITLNGRLHNGVIARIHIPPDAGIYDQILYEPYSGLEFQTSGLEHNLSGISSIAFTLLDQNGYVISNTGGQPWSVLLRIAWT